MFVSRGCWKSGPIKLIAQFRLVQILSIVIGQFQQVPVCLSPVNLSCSARGLFVRFLSNHKKVICKVSVFAEAFVLGWCIIFPGSVVEDSM